MMDNALKTYWSRTVIAKKVFSTTWFFQLFASLDFKLLSNFVNIKSLVTLFTNAMMH